MIEINLVPDVKQELIRAERQRTNVISIAILTSLIFLGIVTLLAVYVFGVQTVRSSLADNSIKSESQKLASVQDLPQTLTIQNQLSKLSSMHDEKQITSRIFDILATIDPPAPNNMTLSGVTLDTELKTVSLEGFGANYGALEIFKKTIEATTLQYNADGENQTVPLSERVDIIETSYGENSDGGRVLRFVISFDYSDEIFSRSASGARIVAPNRENATDSFRRLPQSLFGDQADDIEGEN